MSNEIFAEIISDLRGRLSVACEMPMTSPFGRYCIQAQQDLEYCNKRIFNADFVKSEYIAKLLASRKLVVKKGYYIEIGDQVAYHCGNRECRMAALLRVCVHASDKEVAQQQAALIANEDPQLQLGRDALRMFVERLEDLLGSIKPGKSLTNRNHLCCGIAKEIGCCLTATESVKIKKFSAVCCRKQECLRRAMLNVVYSKYRADANVAVRAVTRAVTRSVRGLVQPV